MTVAEAILKIRQVGLNKETIYTCYVTEKRKLIGYVDVKELLTTSESKLIEEIMETNLLYAHTTDDQEDVVRMITKYGLIALPILDHENCMVGIVTVDDAMDVMQEETTEDISIMAGVAPNEDSYFETTVLEHVKSRLPWLLFLMLSATITQMIMNSYESALAVMPQLAGFIPMLTGTGGNCGSQSSTLVIRGLAVEEIEFADLPKVIWKEVRVAVCISLVLAGSERDPHPDHGTGRRHGCADDRTDHGVYGCDRQGSWMYPASVCEKSRTGSGHHGYTSDFHVSRHQHHQCIFRNRQQSISTVIFSILYRKIDISFQ